MAAPTWPIYLLKNRSKIISIGAPITKKRPFKKLKTLSFLASFISKIKTADILNFLSVKYFGKGLLFLIFWLIRVNYCWNYGPSNLLFLFRFLNSSKGQLADRIFKLWKTCVYDYRVVKHRTFEILTFQFWFANFQTNFVKNFMKKLPGFKIDFESTDKVLPLHQYVWSEISRQWNNSP